MNKPSKCKNCQWYGKPYWSIINPCDNCPMENVEKFTHWVDPTIEQKDKEIERLNNIIDELEKDLEEVFIKMKEKQVRIGGRGYYYTDLIPIEDVLDKLKKLKEGK